MAQRQYEPFTLFNIRIADMRHLWTPSTEYKGQTQTKPNYFAGFITPKTQAQWSAEPAFADLMRAYGKLYATNPQIMDWRIQDGDLPGPDGKSSEFAKGHWLFNASTSNAPNVEMVQAGGNLVELQNKVGVKSGDYCMIGCTAAVSGQNNRAVKLYLNSVVFTAPGEEIVFANSVSGAELMAQAKAQGLQVAGFASSPGGFVGGAQNSGPGFTAPDQRTGMFAPPQGNTPGGFAPPPVAGVTAFPSNGAPSFVPPASPFGGQ